MLKPRTHPRVTLEFEVTVRVPERVFTARSYQLGAGGMALRDVPELQVALPIELLFTLPQGPAVSVPAVVWWKEKGLVGVRFDVSSPQRDIIERWVREHLGDASFFAKPI
jgi:hypothetical protein